MLRFTIEWREGENILIFFRLSRLSFDFSVLEVYNFFYLSGREMAYEGRSFLYIAIVDLPLNFELVFVEHDILAIQHLLLHFRLRMSIYSHLFLPVLVFLSIVLTRCLEDLSRDLTHYYPLVADVHLHLLGLAHCIATELSIEGQLTITKKFALLQHSDNHLLQYYAAVPLFVLRRLSFGRITSSHLLSTQFYLTIGYEIQSLGFFALGHYLFGDGESEWLCIIDYELKLVRLQLLEQSTLVEHLNLFVVNPLSVQLNNLIKPICIYRTYHCPVLFGLSSQPSLLAMDKLSLTKADSLLIDINFLVVILDLSLLCFLQLLKFAFLDDRQAEGHFALDDQIDGLGNIAFIVDGPSLVIEFELDILSHIPQQFALLDRIFQYFFEDINSFEALLQYLFSEEQLHEGAVAVGPSVRAFGVAIVYYFQVAQVQTLEIHGQIPHFIYKLKALTLPNPIQFNLSDCVTTYLL